MLSLKVLIDHKANKVVFAEADSNFIDVLFNIMTLPLGTIVKILNTHLGPQKEAIGSLNNLYDSLSKLSGAIFWTEEAKSILLNPKSSSQNESRKLKLEFHDAEPTKYYVCADPKCTKENPGSVYVSTFNVSRCSCGNPLNREMKVKSFNSKKDVFTRGRATFIIRDDLLVLPNFIGTTIELLNSFGLRDLTMLEEKTLDVNSKEIISLLKASVISKTPLSEWFLRNKSHRSETFYSEVIIDTTADLVKMDLKVVVHKLTRKVLFAQAEEDFIDFLFNLLPIPLGKVVSLYSGNTSVVGIDNLYKSISCLNSEKYLTSENVKTILLNPKLSHQYLFKNQIFPATEYCSHPNIELSWDDCKTFRHATIIDPKAGNQGFVGGPATFIVTDDLEVTPFSSLSSLLLLNKLGIPFCDVEELQLKIGMKECLGILRASLCSSTALTNGLGLMLMKPAKQEK